MMDDEWGHNDCAQSPLDCLCLLTSWPHFSLEDPRLADGDGLALMKQPDGSTKANANLWNGQQTGQQTQQQTGQQTQRYRLFNAGWFTKKRPAILSQLIYLWSPSDTIVRYTWIKKKIDKLFTKNSVVLSVGLWFLPIIAVITMAKSLMVNIQKVCCLGTESYDRNAVFARHQKSESCTLVASAISRH